MKPWTRLHAFAHKHKHACATQAFHHASSCPLMERNAVEWNIDNNMIIYMGHRCAWRSLTASRERIGSSWPSCALYSSYTVATVAPTHGQKRGCYVELPCNAYVHELVACMNLHALACQCTRVDRPRKWFVHMRCVVSIFLCLPTPLNTVMSYSVHLCNSIMWMAHWCVCVCVCASSQCMCSCSLARLLFEYNALAYTVQVRRLT